MGTSHPACYMGFSLGAPENIVGSAHGIPASPLQLVLKKVQRPIIELKKVNNI